MISIKNSVLRFFGTRGIVNRIETIYGYIKIPSPLNKLKRLSNVTIGVTNDVTCDEKVTKDSLKRTYVFGQSLRINRSILVENIQRDDSKI